MHRERKSTYLNYLETFSKESQVDASTAVNVETELMDSAVTASKGCC